jgi:hypothetical protein
MPRSVITISLALLAAPLLLLNHDANACSCSPPQPKMLSPARLSSAPVNSRVRVVLPKFLKGNLVLRKHKGADVPFQRIDSSNQYMPDVEIVPKSKLDSNTRYEVALVNPEEHPTTFVFGTFVTGSDIDSVAPTDAKITRTVVNAHRSSVMTSCAVGTPWVQVFLNKSEDPGHTDVPVLYAVWASTGKNKIDLNAPPIAFVEEKDGILKLGRTSYCDPDDFPLPMNGSVSLAIAAVDQAGNRSALQRTTVVISSPPEANQ